MGDRIPHGDGCSAARDGGYGGEPPGHGATLLTTFSGRAHHPWTICREHRRRRGRNPWCSFALCAARIPADSSRLRCPELDLRHRRRPANLQGLGPARAHLPDGRPAERAPARNHPLRDGIPRHRLRSARDSLPEPSFVEYVLHLRDHARRIPPGDIRRGGCVRADRTKAHKARGTLRRHREELSRILDRACRRAGGVLCRSPPPPPPGWPVPNRTGCCLRRWSRG